MDPYFGKKKYCVSNEFIKYFRAFEQLQIAEQLKIRY